MFLALYRILVAGVAALVLGWPGCGCAPGRGKVDLDPYEVAMLAGGPRRVAETAELLESPPPGELVGRLVATGYLRPHRPRRWPHLSFGVVLALGFARWW